jgi:GAF domain-containing protein
MEPLPETFEAIQRLSQYGDSQIAAELLRIGRQVQQVVPEVVGVSIGLPAEQFTFTLVADTSLAHEMDVMQYVDDGPCVQALHSGDVVETDLDDLLDEDRWLMFARASALHGVESSLSLPIVREGQVVAGVNLYASAPDAFVGHHEELAAICRAWAPGAVTNADLAFSTRLEAAATPGRMRDQSLIDQAIGMLAESQQVDTETAAARLREAALRAGISEAQAAQTIIRALSTS